MPHKHSSRFHMTAPQVEAAMRSSGLQPLGSSEAIAESLDTQLVTLTLLTETLTLNDTPAQFVLRQRLEAM